MAALASGVMPAAETEVAELTEAPEAAEAATAPAVAASTSAPATASGEVVLDEAILRQLVELGGPEFAAELYQEFEQEAGDLLREAEPAVAASAFTELLPMLHQLKGTSATLGGVALAAQARRLEHDFKARKLDGGAAGFQLLQHYFAQFIAEYPRAVERAMQAPAS
jgi:HPt (histidine-containing phosphotransfer) domain-containing protein